MLLVVLGTYDNGRVVEQGFAVLLLNAIEDRQCLGDSSHVLINPPPHDGVGRFRVSISMIVLMVILVSLGANILVALAAEAIYQAAEVCVTGRQGEGEEFAEHGPNPAPFLVVDCIT